MRETTRVEFVILGQTALRSDGEPISLGAAKQRALLAVLLYHAGEPLRVDSVVEYLWDDRRPDAHRDKLYPMVSRIRQALRRAGIFDALARVPGMDAYRLDVRPELIDYHRIRIALAQARDAVRLGRHDIGAELLAPAMHLWAGEPLADVRGAAAEHLRRQMEDVWLEAQKLYADCLLRAGQHRKAMVLLDPLRHDLDEFVAQRWIAALCADGRYEEARSYYQDFRRRYRRQVRMDPAVTLPDAAAPKTQPAGTRAIRRAPPVGASVPRQLPRDISDFIGQRHLLAELDVLTGDDGERASVVVVNGMPGAGKTTLVTHWAHERAYRYPDGQLYLNAHAYGPMPPVSPEEALGRFLRAFDVPPDRMPSGVEPRRDRLNQILAGRRVLVVLDNVRDAGQVRPLIPAAGGCLTLVTSRNQLAGLAVHDGARSLSVPPLPDDDGVALVRGFIGWQRADAEPAEVRALAGLSGGLPLALRIIAYRVTTRPRVPIAEMVGELTTRLLDDEGDDEEASLRTAFRWSYVALPAAAARLFRMAGLHPGTTISPEAAAALLGTAPGDAERLLDALARAHLINYDTARRYRFHDLLRWYAADQVRREEPEDRQAAAIRRLLDWYLLSAAAAAKALSPQRTEVPDLPVPTDVTPKQFRDDAEAQRWGEAERGNLAAITRLAMSRGLYKHAWQVPGAIHEMYERYGRQDDVLELHKLALSAARRSGHKVGEVVTLNNLAAIHYVQHDYDIAVANLETGLRLARTIGHDRAERVGSFNLASAYLRLGEVRKAIRLFEELLEAARSSGTVEARARALHRLGEAFAALKEYDRAKAYYYDALVIAEDIDALRQQGAILGQLAALYLEIGRPREALQHGGRAVDVCRRVRDEKAQCAALTAVAEAELRLGMGEAAAGHAGEAAALAEKIGESLGRCRALEVLARALEAAGDGAGARRVSQEAVEILDQVTDPGAGDLGERLEAIRRRAA